MLLAIVCQNFRTGLAASADQSGPIHYVYDRFDMLEVNHLYDEFGRHTLTQLIYWDWHKFDDQFHVEGWQLIKGDHFRDMNEDELAEYSMLVETIVSRLPLTERHRVRGMFMRSAKIYEGGKLHPVKNHRTGLYEVMYADPNLDGQMRKIAAPIFRETWTNQDPDREDRIYQPEDQRRGLKKTRHPERDPLWQALRPSIQRFFSSLKLLNFAELPKQ